MFAFHAITAALTLVVQTPVAQVADRHALVETITAAAGVGGDPTPALEAIEVLRESLSDRQSLDRGISAILLSIVRDTQSNARVRVVILNLLCERADRHSAEQIFGLMDSLIDRLRNVAGHHDPEFYALPALMVAFLEKGAKSLAIHLEDPARLLELYDDILKGPREQFNEWMRAHCFERIADNPAPLSVRQRYMLRLLERISGQRGPETFIPLVTDDIVPRLREIAFDGPVGRYGYNVAAVDLLAEHGDLETARRLRSLAKEQGFDSEIVTRVGGYVWMIESQHAPDMLLDHIRSAEWVDHQTRLWALKHAIALKVYRGELRAALLEHARHLSSDTRLQGDARRLKKLAVQRGILKPGEFIVPPEDPLMTNIRRAIGAAAREEETPKGYGD